MNRLQIRTAPWLVVALASSASLLHAQPAPYDVVVYGGSSAAVTAAVEVARLGKSVVLVTPDAHLGGMTSSGLGWTDIGDRDTIGGMSREFYNHVYTHYLDNSAWTTETRSAYFSRSSLDPDAARQLMFTFEPKVARGIFNDFIAEAGVTVVSGRLNRTNGVVMNGSHIASIATTTGATFVGKAYIDATYEGDLMAAAGVSYTVGREANSQYGETLNGIQTARATKNQLPGGIDPYVIPGNPASGLLPGVNATAGGPDGSADKRLQSYNMRMVLTNKASNRLAVPQPPNYNEANYELLFRAITAGQTSGFFKLDPMPNNKTDSNNSGGISTDYIGANYVLSTNVNFAVADYATRDAMVTAQRDWQMGLVYALQHSTRVPASIRDTWDDWGLPADEFTDSGNWTDQVYVREARRMVSSVVINQKNVDQQPGYVFTDSVGMGGYNMDSHNVQRYVGPGGDVRNEGDIQVAPANGPYAISYGAIVPKQGEADNLIVPVAVSATHIAYGSLRMEPVFMTLGQSAGAAAVLAGEHGVPARDVPYALLRSQLVRDGQALGGTYASPDAGILLNFGGLVSNDANSPGHAVGGLTGVQWNLVGTTGLASVVNGQGAATGVAVDLGKSPQGQQSINWNADGFNAIVSGSSQTTGVYAGNARSAIFVNDGSASAVDLGVRISGLTPGVYDAFLTAKNTNVATDEGFKVYALIVGSNSGNTDYTSAAATILQHGADASWKFGETFTASTVEIHANQDLVLVVEGITAGEMRGFINTLELVKLSGLLTADVNGDGIVDVGDFSLIRQNFLKTVAIGASGDANSDGKVDFRDFYFWRAAYLQQGGNPAAIANLNVPEPSTAVGLMLVSLMAHRSRGAWSARVLRPLPLMNSSSTHLP
jgi:hypothetical protein